MSTFYFYTEYVINALFQRQSLNVEFGTVVATATVLLFPSRPLGPQFHRIQDLAAHVMQFMVADHPLSLWFLTLPALSTGLGKHHIVIIPERSLGVLVIPAIPWGIRGPEKACDLPEHMLQHPGNAEDQHRTVGIESTFRCKFSLYHWENWGQKENSRLRSHSELGQVGTWAHGFKVLGSVIKSQALGQLSFLGFGQICFLSTHTYTVRCILGYNSWNGVYSCMFSFHGSLVVWQ